MATNPQIKYDILANAQGAQDVAKLALKMGNLDASLDPAAAIRATELARALRTLGQQQEAVRRFVELKQGTEQARVSMEQAQCSPRVWG